MNKADIWDMCVKQNIFEGYQDIMLPKIQEIFEKTLENNINDSTIIEKIRENLKDDNSYIVQAEMIRQLGLIGDRSYIEIIEKLLPQRSPRKIIQNAARSSISNLKG